MTRAGIAFVAISILALAWFVWASQVAPPPLLPEGEVAVAPTAVDEIQHAPLAPATAMRATSQDGSWWSASLALADAAVVAAADDDTRAGVMRGRLTVRQQPWIHPAGVEVRLTRSWLDSVIPVETAPEVQTPSRDELRTTTDEHGYFAFRLVPPAMELFFLIGHRSSWQDFQKVPKLPRAGQEIDLGDVLLDQRGEIVGRVMNGSGATVRAVDDPLLDGTSGFEELRTARMEGLELFRARGTMIGGPVPDWVVRRDGFLPFPTTTTDTNGDFRLTGVRPGNHNLFVQSRGGHCGRSDGILVAAGRTTQVGTISLRAPGNAWLKFVDETQKPWVGARVACIHDALGFGNPTVRTDGGGRVVLPLADGPRARLLFALPSGGPWLEVPWPNLPEVSLRNDVIADAIVVPRPSDLTVMLIDSGGRLLPGGTVRAYVQAEAFRTVDRELPAGMQPREREPGVHKGLLACPTVLVASVPGFAPAMAIATGSKIAMTMLPMQTITVRVHDLQDHAIAGAAVRAQVHGNPELRFPGAQWSALANDRVLIGITDDRGELEVPVWPTFFSFQASHRDYAPSANPKVLPVPGQRLDLLLLGGGAVHGTLTIEMRPAPAGLRVRAKQRPPAGHDLATSGFLDERIAVTGRDGTFAFRQLVAGIWELSPELPSVPAADGARRMPQPWQGKRVQLDEGQELYTTIEIQPDYLAPVQISGVVTQNGATVASALVRVRELDPPELRERNQQRRRLRSRATRGGRDVVGPEEVAPWRRCETDAFGEFRFRELTPDVDHELRVDIPAGGRLQFVGRRVVRAGTALHPVRLDFALSTSDVRITCLYEGRPLQNRMLRLRQIVDKDTEGARFELLLDANGQAWVDQLPTGTWTIEPMHGGRCEPGQFEVATNTAAMPTITVFDR